MVIQVTQESPRDLLIKSQSQQMDVLRCVTLDDLRLSFVNQITRTVRAYHKDPQCSYLDSPPGPDHLVVKILLIRLHPQSFYLSCHSFLFPTCQFM